MNSVRRATEETDTSVGRATDARLGVTSDAGTFDQALWRKSQRSQNSGACVEVARVGDLFGVRDSKNPGGPVLVFTVQEFEAFLDGVRNGDFDQLVS